ncbi:hypothetical protein ACQWKD_003801, partial [Acinetobacter baumannii]
PNVNNDTCKCYMIFVFLSYQRILATTQFNAKLLFLSLYNFFMHFLQKQIIQSKNTVIKNMSSHGQIIMLSIDIDSLLV